MHKESFTNCLKVIWKLFRNYCNTYPRIAKNVDICAYYRKHNRTAPISFFLLIAGFVFTQVARGILAIINQDPWEYWADLLIMWLLVDLSLVFCGYLCFKVFRGASLQATSHVLRFQKKAFMTLQACCLIPTLTFASVSFFLPTTTSKGDIASLIWVCGCILQLQVCIWCVDGLLYKIFLMSVFNCGYCMVAIHKGYFVFLNTPKVVVPIILSISFFIAFDRYTKENFILKQTLKQQKNMYEKHLEKVQDPVVILDQSQLLFSNEASRSRIASSLDEFWKKTGFIVSEKGECLNDTIKERLQDKNLGADAVTQKKYYMHDMGSDTIIYNRILTVTAIESTFFARQKIVSLAFHDVTEDLLREQNRVEEKYKNMLFFSLSHELRTPLNIFQAFLGIAKRALKTPEEQDMHKNAKGAWRYLRNKISDILDYAQILSDEFVLHKTKFSLRGFVRNLEKMTFCLLAKKREAIRLDFSVQIGVRDDFFSDRDRLEQVLFNFLSNAVKYTTAGTIALHVFPPNHDKRNITFEVSDTGCGMEPEFVSSLFELKSRKVDSVEISGKEHNKKSTGLSGLGLTVSKMICNRMGSDIKVNSIKEKGSTFSFTLVDHARESSTGTLQGLNAVPDEGVRANHCKTLEIAAGQRKPSACNTQRKRTNVNVLVVDDNELNRCVVKGMVKKLGFNTTEADNGKAAIDKLTELQALNQDGTIVVFMDVDMPVMDGIEATAEIRKANKSPQPQIIALTAFASEAERTKCLDAGMNGFISKPLTKGNLVDLFNNLQLLEQF
eukprot:TRINITY_DN36_c0_g2_i4.p1 TRINITY_DN36_c0_g2~~TRINITY_DN36_c0_g2_i4.p1  ORF type:complete len:782 (-),score=61.39 TRINITY_DN36_c0_g2_i4:5432-7777(-)